MALITVLSGTFAFCHAQFRNGPEDDARRAELAVHRAGYVETPPGSVRRAEDRGKRAHTNILLWHDSNPVATAPKAAMRAHPEVLYTTPSIYSETPASVACIYHLVTPVSGCPISSTTALPNGGGAIAIVDAYDDPNAASDLATFSSYFGLPTATLDVVYASGTRPAQDSTGTWELEESLDIEWAHAMAPYAIIYLVEAASNSTADLMAAENVAKSYVQRYGDMPGGVVSNSWGAGEYSGESGNDSNFTGTGVTYYASTGDCGFCLEYPAVSPNVIAVGGTSIQRDGSGNFLGETYWTDGGGGLSSYEYRPSFQSGISSLVGSMRGVPDVSSIADPSTGVAVYDSFPYSGTAYGWIQVGGTSLAAPLTAARVSTSGAVGAVYDTSYLQSYIYGELAASTAYPTNFRDITSGSSSCVTGWDICTGIGSPVGTGWLPSVTPIRPNAYDDMGTDDPSPWDGWIASSQPSGPLGSSGGTATPHGTYYNDPYDGWVYTTVAVNAADDWNCFDDVCNDQQLSGLCTWTFASQTTSHDMVLYIPYTFGPANYSDAPGTATFNVQVTVNGTTTSTNVFGWSSSTRGMLTTSIPAGTNMANVSVQIWSSGSTPQPSLYSGTYNASIGMYTDIFVQ